MKDIRSIVKDFTSKADMFLFTICFICSIFGILVISSATASYESRTFVPVQIFALVLGIALFVLFTVIDVDIFADKWPILIGIETFLMLLLIPFGVSGDTGNSGWLRFFGIGIQPSEVVKVIFIVLMAKHMSYLREYKSINSVLSVAQLLGHFGFTFLLVFITSEDLGSAIVFFAIFLIMMIGGAMYKLVRW